MAILRIKDSNGKFIKIPSIPGKSAYEIAVEKGVFKGTEQEFAEMQVFTNKEILNQITQENIDRWNENGSNGEYATKDELEEELSTKANISDIPTKVSQLTNDSNYLTSIPSEYITETELEDKKYLTEHQDISHLASKTELTNGLSTKANISDIPTKISDLTNDSDYLTSIPSEYITETELEDKKYLTEHQDISHLATKDELNTKANILDVPTKVSQLTNDSNFISSIPSEYITEDELNQKGYLTEHQDISHLASKDELEEELSTKANISDIPTKVSQLTNDSNYLTNIPSEYITETELEAEISRIQSQGGMTEEEKVELNNKLAQKFDDVALNEQETTDMQTALDFYADGQVVKTVYFTGGSGSGGSTSAYISTTLSENVLVGIGENFDLILDFVSPNLGKGTLKVFINDIDSVTKSIGQGEGTYTISGDLFTKGTNRVVVYVLDRVGTMSNSLVFYLRYGSTELVSDFDVYSYYDYGATIRYYFTPTALDTSLSLTFYMSIDGQIQQGVSCKSDTRGYYTFPTNLSANSHYCEAYVIDSNNVKSNVLSFNLIILDDNIGTLVVASDTKEATIEEGEQLSLDYKVYMKNNTSFITKTYVDNVLVNTGTCGLDFNYYRTSSLIEGIRTVKLEIWDVTETYSDYIIWTITVTPSTYEMLQPINAGAMFIGTAINKTNSDERRDVFIGYDQTDSEILGNLYNFAYNSESGWVDDELIISGNSHVEIPIQPLANNARYGFTLDIEFTSKQIGVEDAEVLTLWNEEKNCGIKITTENLILRSAEGNECRLYYSDNERTNVVFVIDRQELKAKIYLNGVMCRAFHLSDYTVDGVAYLEDFTVNSNVYLGGYNKNGYSKIRNLRIYQVALTTDEILNNWMSCEINKSAQRALVEFQKGNDLPTLTVYCDFSGLGKDDKKPCKIVYNSTDEVKYGKSFVLDHKESQLQYQGTSSMAYPIKNYRLNLRDENGEKWYYDFPNGKPECRFTLKAD